MPGSTAAHPQTLPWRLLEGLASASATPTNSWTWSRASPWPGSAWNCPGCPSTCRSPRPSTCGAREPQGHVGSAECGQELETLLSQGATHRTSPLGGSLPSPPWDLQPLLCPLPPLSPRLRAETGPPASAIHLCPPQTVALFFWVTLAPTPGPAGWRRA